MIKELVIGMEDVIAFKTIKEWEKWLARNHSSSKGIWMRRFKKASGVKDITGADALDGALCYGWITGQAKPYDEISVLWRFCPRRPKSMWSQLNTQHAERLIREGRMKDAGLREIEAAKQDGRWARAYSSPRNAVMPPDFMKELNKNRDAKAFFKTLNKSNAYAIIFRLQNTKSPERRKEKIHYIIKMLEKKDKFH